MNRLVTSPGSLVHKPEYGVGVKDFQGKVYSLQEQRELLTRIKENLELDPRIVKVTAVKINVDTANPDLFTIVVSLDAIGYNNIVEEYKPFEVSS